MPVVVLMAGMAQVLAPRGARTGRSEAAVSGLLCAAVLSCCCCGWCLPVALSLGTSVVLGGALLAVVAAALLVRGAQSSAAVSQRHGAIHVISRPGSRIS